MSEKIVKPYNTDRSKKEEVAEMGGSGKSLHQIMKEKKVMNMEELMKLHDDA